MLESKLPEIKEIFRHIEASATGNETESDFAGLFDNYDVNINKLGATVAKRSEQIVKLLNGVVAMNLGKAKSYVKTSSYTCLLVYCCMAAPNFPSLLCIRYQIIFCNSLHLFLTTILR